MRKSIFKKDKRYTFSDYFEMNIPLDEIVGEFDYSLNIESLELPRFEGYDHAITQNMKETFYQTFPKISLTTEIAKREILIAPLLINLVKISSVRLNIEYPVEIDDKLCGSFDYFLRSEQDLIVIEAKKSDLERGFNQLAVELIALDKLKEPNETNVLYGAITVGETWRFGLLRRPEKTIVQDVNTFGFPKDVDDIFSILLGVLGKNEFN